MITLPSWLNKYIAPVCLLSLFASILPSAYGNSGATAIAYPMDDITVDGDLSDWPADIQTYPVKQFEYGDKPVDDRDLNVHFRVGYNADEHSLFVAVEIVDDSSVIDRSPNANWDSQDGCEVYVDGVHSAERSAQAQYGKFGDQSSVFGSGRLDDFRVAVGRKGATQVYEWRIDLGDEPMSVRSLGFDIAVCDRDADGTFSWAAWSPGTQKVQSPDRCGDVLLLQPDTSFGEVFGEIQWRDPSQKPLPPRVHIRSRQFPNLWMATTVDANGRYTAKLPTGSYSVQASDSREVRVDDSVKVDVGVSANESTSADLLAVAPLPKPALIGDTGVLRRSSPVDSAEIERFVQAYMAYYRIPGLSLALLKDGQVVYRAGFGVKHAATGDKVDPSTVFNAASMTKVVFAYLVNRLVERGVLEWDTPLHTYLPFEPVAHDERSQRITARMVLNHSTGFPNWFSGKPEIKFEPGTAFGYSGIGFVYLGNVVSHLTGRKVEDLIEEEVFAPMGIQDASLVWKERFEELTAFPHPHPTSPQPPWRPSEPNVASSLYISAENYGKFLLALMKGQGLSGDALQEMLRPQNEVPREDWGLKPNQTASYGLGIAVEGSPHGTWYSHGGSNPGFTSKFELHDEGRTGYVFLVNNQQGHNFNQDLQAFLITGKQSD